MDLQTSQSITREQLDKLKAERERVLEYKKRNGVGSEIEVSGELEPEIPEWIRSPATVRTLHSKLEYTTAANEYFSWCCDTQTPPQLTHLCLALGLAGVSSFNRLARRRADLREVFSRCTTAIAAGYERLLTTSSSRGAIFALKHLPDFDLEDEPGSPEIPFWTDKQSIEVISNIPGITAREDIGADMTPEEAYVQIMRGGKAFETLKHAVEKDHTAAKNPLIQLMKKESASLDS